MKSDINEDSHMREEFSDEEKKSEEDEFGWNLDGKDEDDDDGNHYVKEVQHQMKMEQIEQQKKTGIGFSANIQLGLVSSISLQKFVSTKFYKDAIEAQEYLQKNESIVKGWLNLVIIKEMMLIKAEIDLNYIDMHPSNLEIYGWKIDQPLVITIEANEIRMVNSIKDEEF